MHAAVTVLLALTQDIEFIYSSRMFWPGISFLRMRVNLNSFHAQQLIKIVTLKIIFVIFLLPIYFLLNREEVKSIDILNGTKSQPVEYDNKIMDLKYRPWNNDSECNKYFIEFIRGRNYPKMALASYPGSGNTWMRGIIERMTGYFTGSVSNESKYKKTN